MRSRSILLSSLIMFAVACSSSGKSNQSDSTPTDPAMNPAPDNNPSMPDMDSGVVADSGSDTSMTAVDSGPTEPTNQAECIAVCEQKYPKAASENKMLDSTCFLSGACEPVCDNLAGGKDFPPTVDPDAGVVCNTEKANSYPITTPSAACSTCIANTPSCCNQWITIFASTDGQALNACSNTCFSTFAH